MKLEMPDPLVVPSVGFNFPRSVKLRRLVLQRVAPMALSASAKLTLTGRQGRVGGGGGDGGGSGCVGGSGIGSEVQGESIYI